MPAALVVAHGPALYLFVPGADRPTAFRSGGEGGTVARPGADPRPEAVPPELVRELERIAPGREIAVGGPRLAAAIAGCLNRSVSPAAPSIWRPALSRIPAPGAASERSFLRAIAAAALERALASPEEVLITLAREEERLERTVGREARAAESMAPVPVAAVATYIDRGRAVRADLARHHAELVAALEASARGIVPNLSAVVGPRVAARLVAAAGGVAPLARFSAGRIQLLGTRRRPDPERGPRFGILYRAERIADVPPRRRAAFARSLAAMAAIAVRADGWTHGSIGSQLRARRDRRVEELTRRGS